MQANPQRKKEREALLSTLNMIIEGLNLAKEICSIAPAKAALARLVSSSP